MAFVPCCESFIQSTFMLQDSSAKVISYTNVQNTFSQVCHYINIVVMISIHISEVFLDYCCRLKKNILRSTQNDKGIEGFLVSVLFRQKVIDYLDFITRR